MNQTGRMRRVIGVLTALTAAFAAVIMISFGGAFSAQSVHAAGLAYVKTAVIQGSNVVVTAKSDDIPATDDGIYHLFAQTVYQAGGQGVEVAQAPAAASAQFVFPLNYNTALSNLYKKFTIVAYQNGVATQVSNSMYITNPEAIAQHTTARRDHGKKGLLPAAELFNTSNIARYGIQQITYNVPIGSMCSGTGINYNYNGKVYTFNAGIVGQYDQIVPKMNAAGIQVTLIILNDWKSDINLIHPYSRDNTAQNYYAFNTADEAGTEKIAAVASFLAERYSNTGHGTVDNWIIGNEVNARSPWHYMNAGVGIDSFTLEYSKAFRLFYNGIKSQNANARVYVCVDQEYAVSDGALHYSGKDLLTKFNTDIAGEGNIAWGAAIHPYDVPLTNPTVWTMTSTAYANHTQDSRYITMQNIDVFTDYMCTAAMREANGQVRSILCSEVGYPSNLGEQVQAAAIVYSYLQACANQHIDGFILNREMDHQAEIAQGLATGILNVNGTPKTAMNWYMNAESASVQAAASNVIGADITSFITVR